MIVSFWKDNDDEFMGTNFLVSDSEDDALAMIQVIVDSEGSTYFYEIFEGREWTLSNSDPSEPREEHFVFEYFNQSNHRSGKLLPTGKED